MTAKYRVLADKLKEQIDSGTRGRLPTERELCQIHGVSRQTVRQALALLQKENYIEKRQGSGNYILGAPREEPKKVALITTGLAENLPSREILDFQSFFSAGGCSIQMFFTGNRISREREILLNLIQRPVDGICVEGTCSALPNPNLDLYRRLQNMEIPLVFLKGAYEGLEDVVCVSMDPVAGSYLAVRHLAEQGHTRIGLLGEGYSRGELLRYGACVSAVRDYGLPMMDRCYFWRPTHLSPEEGFFADVSRRLFRECTAVICQKEELAWLLIRALKGMGVSVPEDFAVLCFAERESRGAEIQAMERLVCGEASLGRTAAEKLQNMISGKPESGMEFSWTLQKR